LRGLRQEVDVKKGERCEGKKKEKRKKNCDKAVELERRGGEG